MVVAPRLRFKGFAVAAMINAFEGGDNNRHAERAIADL